MRPAPAGYAAATRYGHRATATCSAWLDGRMLSADVPLVAGALAVDAAQASPEVATIIVPTRDPATGTRWVPRALDDPLAAAGQRIRLTRGIDRHGTDHAIALGWYRIQDWDESEGELRITAEGLLSCIDYLFGAPFAPTGSSLTAVVTALAAGQFGVQRHPMLIDRACPPSLAWSPDKSRLSALQEVLAAWPARARASAQGVLMLEPADLDTPQPIELRAGADGQIISQPTSGTRDGIYNAYLVTGQSDNDDRAPVYAFYRDERYESPYRWSGPFGPATGNFASPLMTTEAQCAAAGRTLVEKSQRATRPVKITHAPDARIEHDDIVIVPDPAGGIRRGRVLGYTLPLTAADGEQVTTVGTP